ncbi:hypothetical protein [Kitasatospora paranensis]|uniref:Transposase n=1 Tax=Kitasatospora paranensis TaxID=258053 RepID=A0ABW2FZG8_9ACTN
MADTGDELAAALYALPVGEFTAARDRAAAGARQDGDRALAARIRKLRRPTAAAHAVNLLARAHAADLTGLLDLGRALRTAQRDGDGPALRELSARRHRTITVLTALAVRDAAARGEQLSEAQQREVERTLRAATADEGAARLAAAGCLPAALDEMPAGLPAAPGPTPGGNGGGRATPVDGSAAEADQERRRTADRAARVAARAALGRAAAELDAAHAALSDLTRKQAELTGRRERAEQAVAEAAQALRAAEDGLLTARQSEDRLRAEHGEAARQTEAAKARAEAAQRALEDLDGG